VSKEILLASLAALICICFLNGCSQEVQTGQITSCKHCGMEISNTVNIIKVPFWKVDEYQVTRSLSYCDKCGSELVTYQIKLQCQYCGEIWQTFARDAMRRYEPCDTVKTLGYCSTRCENWAKVDGTIDKVSEKTGDVLGRISKGLYDGIKKHTQ